MYNSCDDSEIPNGLFKNENMNTDDNISIPHSSINIEEEKSFEKKFLLRKRLKSKTESGTEIALSNEEINEKINNEKTYFIKNGEKELIKEEKKLEIQFEIRLTIFAKKKLVSTSDELIQTDKSPFDDEDDEEDIED